MMPAPQPDAMPSEEMREVARESATLNSSLSLREADVPSRGIIADSFPSDESCSPSVSSSDARICADWEDSPLELIRADMTSGEALARAGRYAFMATEDVPKPTLAQIANTATRIHSGDEDDSDMKSMAEKEPIAANMRRSGFRHVAGGERDELVFRARMIGWMSGTHACLQYCPWRRPSGPAMPLIWNRRRDCTDCHWVSAGIGQSPT